MCPATRAGQIKPRREHMVVRDRGRIVLEIRTRRCAERVTPHGADGMAPRLAGITRESPDGAPMYHLFAFEESWSAERRTLAAETRKRYIPHWRCSGLSGLRYRWGVSLGRHAPVIVEYNGDGFDFRRLRPHS